MFDLRYLGKMLPTFKPGVHPQFLVREEALSNLLNFLSACQESGEIDKR